MKISLIFLIVTLLITSCNVTESDKNSKCIIDTTFEKILQPLGYDSSRGVFDRGNIKCRFFLCDFVVKYLCKIDDEKCEM